MPVLHCNNAACRYNRDLDCMADPVHYVDRLCITFRRRPRGENYRELMKSPAGICHRERGSMRKESREVLK